MATSVYARHLVAVLELVGHLLCRTCDTSCGVTGPCGAAPSDDTGTVVVWLVGGAVVWTYVYSDVGRDAASARYLDSALDLSVVACGWMFVVFDWSVVSWGSAVLIREVSVDNL